MSFLMKLVNISDCELGVSDHLALATTTSGMIAGRIEQVQRYLLGGPCSDWSHIKISCTVMYTVPYIQYIYLSVLIRSYVFLYPPVVN